MIAASLALCLLGCSTPAEPRAPLDRDAGPIARLRFRDRDLPVGPGHVPAWSGRACTLDTERGAVPLCLPDEPPRAFADRFLVLVAGSGERAQLAARILLAMGGMVLQAPLAEADALWAGAAPVARERFGLDERQMGVFWCGDEEELRSPVTQGAAPSFEDAALLILAGMPGPRAAAQVAPGRPLLVACPRRGEESDAAEWCRERRREGGRLTYLAETLDASSALAWNEVLAFLEATLEGTAPEDRIVVARHETLGYRFRVQARTREVGRARAAMTRAFDAIDRMLWFEKEAAFAGPDLATGTVLERAAEVLRELGAQDALVEREESHWLSVGAPPDQPYWTLDPGSPTVLGGLTPAIEVEGAARAARDVGGLRYVVLLGPDFDSLDAALAACHDGGLEGLARHLSLEDGVSAWVLTGSGSELAWLHLRPTPDP